MERSRLAVLAAVLALLLICAYFTGAFQKVFGGANHATAAGAAENNAAANTPALSATGTDTSASSTDATAFTPLPLQKLSDQELQSLQALPPQQQAEQMLMAAVNHYDGMPA